MARTTPEGVIKVHFLSACANTSAPTVAEISAGTDLTAFISPAGLATPDEGQNTESSDLGSARDKKIPSTISGDIEMECYRDDNADTAWTALARGTSGYLIVAPFGGSGTASALQAGDVCEVWTVRVSNRNPLRYARGDALRFTCNMTVEADPVYAATVT